MQTRSLHNTGLVVLNNVSIPLIITYTYLLIRWLHAYFLYENKPAYRVSFSEPINSIQNFLFFPVKTNCSFCLTIALSIFGKLNSIANQFGNFKNKPTPHYLPEKYAN